MCEHKVEKYWIITAAKPAVLDGILDEIRLLMLKVLSNYSRSCCEPPHNNVYEKENSDPVLLVFGETRHATT